MIGKLQRVALREVWKHEARDFTAWLQDNIEILNETLDVNLSNPEREQSAGDFNVDIVAEDESGNPVVIENQLEKSDHDHLGKLITYLTAIGAKVAIWIVATPRPEHVRAISWLNESSSAHFYLLKVEAVQIGESPPAPLLTLITGPSEESRQIGEKKKEFTERDDIRYRFWTELFGRLRHKTKLFATVSPSTDSWINTGAGTSGLAYRYVIRKHDTNIDLYIDRGKGGEEENERIFEELAQHKDEIERIFGEPLEWQRLEGKRACRIAKRIDLGGYRDEDKWPQVHEAMIDVMIQLEKALKPFIAKLQVG